MPSHFLLALFGPRLYRIFNQRPYEPNLMESSGDKFFAIGNCIYTVCIAISPLLVPYVLFNWTPASYNYAAKMTGTFYALALLLRTCGRMAKLVLNWWLITLPISTDYTQFLDVLNKAKSNDFGACERLKMYDYQVGFIISYIWYFPIDQIGLRWPSWLYCGTDGSKVVPSIWTW